MRCPRSLRCALLTLGLSAALADPARGAAGESPFARSSLDITVAVTDMDAALAFYSDALGFTEVEGFEMPAPLAAAIGLNDGEAMHVRVLVAADETTATRLKLVELAPGNGAPERSARPLREPGYRYVTIFVADFEKALERLREAGVKTHVQQQIPLGDDSRLEVMVTLVADPDGNWIELVGRRPGGDS